MHTKRQKCAVGDALRRDRRGGFTIIELIGAMGILFLLFGCVYSALRSLSEFQAALADESHAVIVMHNVVERLEAEEGRNIEKVKRIFQDEFRRSPLAKNRRLSAPCESRDGVLAARIVKANGKPLAKLELKP